MVHPANQFRRVPIICGHLAHIVPQILRYKKTSIFYTYISQNSTAAGPWTLTLDPPLIAIAIKNNSCLKVAVIEILLTVTLLNLL